MEPRAGKSRRAEVRGPGTVNKGSFGDSSVEVLLGDVPRRSLGVT